MFNYTYLGHHTFPAELQMSLEETLYRSAAQEKKAFLRFFSVPNDTVILGYAQHNDAVINPDIPWTRRMTGGSHVQIGENMLAYTVAVPRDGSFQNLEDMRAYYAALISEALEDLGLSSIEVDNNASTIELENKVVASHAMFWGVHSALLHGLLVIDPYNAKTIANNVRLSHRKIGGKIYKEHSAIKNIPALSTISDLWNTQTKKNTNIIKGLVCDAITAKITGKPVEKRFWKFNQPSIERKTLATAKDLLNTKYQTAQWLHARDPAFQRKKDMVEEIPGEDIDGPLKEQLPYCFWIQVPDKKFKKMADPA